MAVHYPHLRVAVPHHGEAILTTVELDGKMIPATRVQIDTGADIHGQVKIRLEFIGTIELESEAPLAMTRLEPVAEGV